MDRAYVAEAYGLPQSDLDDQTSFHNRLSTDQLFTENFPHKTEGLRLRLLRIELDSTSPPLPLSRMGIS
jgi:hypothetical protein